MIAAQRDRKRPAIWPGCQLTQEQNYLLCTRPVLRFKAPEKALKYEPLTIERKRLHICKLTAIVLIYINGTVIIVGLYSGPSHNSPLTKSFRHKV